MNNDSLDFCLVFNSLRLIFTIIWTFFVCIIASAKSVWVIGVEIVQLKSNAYEKRARRDAGYAAAALVLSSNLPIPLHYKSFFYTIYLRLISSIQAVF